MQLLFLTVGWKDDQVLGLWDAMAASDWGKWRCFVLFCFNVKNGPEEQLHFGL